MPPLAPRSDQAVPGADSDPIGSSRPRGTGRLAELIGGARRFGRRRRGPITVLGSLATAAVLGLLLAGRSHEFVAALSDAGPPVLAVTVLLQIVALLARSEAWHLTIGAAGGTVARRVLYRASSMQVLGSVLNGQLGVAARIAALRHSSPNVSPQVPTLIAAEFPILAVEAMLAAPASFTLVGPLGLAWWLPLVGLAVIGAASRPAAARVSDAAHSRRLGRPSIDRPAGWSSRTSPGRRLAWGVQPDSEEVRQVLAANPLAEGDELFGRGGAVKVLGHPGAQDLEERPIADLLAQRLQRHRAAAVDGACEHRVSLRIRDDDLPERIGRRTAVVEQEVLVPRSDAEVLIPQVLREAGEPLVEPDMLPRPDGDRVAEPLVRELVRDREIG